MFISLVILEFLGREILKTFFKSFIPWRTIGHRILFYIHLTVFLYHFWSIFVSSIPIYLDFLAILIVKKQLSFFRFFRWNLGLTFRLFHFLTRIRFQVY